MKTKSVEWLQLNDKGQNVFPLKSETKQRMSVLTTLIQYNTGSPNLHKNARKLNKRQTGKEEI